jgi:hypothetical protein
MGWCGRGKRKCPQRLTELEFDKFRLQWVSRGVISEFPNFGSKSLEELQTHYLLRKDAIRRGLFGHRATQVRWMRETSFIPPMS